MRPVSPSVTECATEPRGDNFFLPPLFHSSRYMSTVVPALSVRMSYRAQTGFNDVVFAHRKYWPLPLCTGCRFLYETSRHEPRSSETYNNLAHPTSMSTSDVLQTVFLQWECWPKSERVLCLDGLDVLPRDLSPRCVPVQCWAVYWLLLARSELS